MIKTVTEAFNEFLKEKVNLNSNEISKAVASKNNLIKNIENYDKDFFKIYYAMNLEYGSFARKTKKKPIDDIDIMICISADERKYLETYNEYKITVNSFDRDNDLIDETGYLNSTKVINKYIKKLKNIDDYEKSEMHKNLEAATLKLKSYTWNFDIVPCFYTDTGFYLIPDGYGNWKKTDPRIDTQRIEKLNRKCNYKLTELIRLVKYWNERKVTIKVDSYLLETMILNYYESNNRNENDNWFVDWEFIKTVEYLSNEILKDVNDYKKIQGNLNNFTFYERIDISEALKNTYNKAYEAFHFETEEHNQEKSIDKWKEIFGEEFPSYGE